MHRCGLAPPCLLPHQSRVPPPTPLQLIPSEPVPITWGTTPNSLPSLSPFISNLSWKHFTPWVASPWGFLSPCHPSPHPWEPKLFLSWDTLPPQSCTHGASCDPCPQSWFPSPRSPRSEFPAPVPPSQTVRVVFLISRDPELPFLPGSAPACSC